MFRGKNYKESAKLIDKANLYEPAEAFDLVVIKEKLRSAYTVITTGIVRPASFFVRSLNSFVNAPMLTPCWPRAGPTGGAGVALPAGICNLMIPVTFCATFVNLLI